MTPPGERSGSVLALVIPGIGSLGLSTSTWLAHAPVTVAIAGGIVGTVATAVVAIVKIRAERSPEQIRAESKAAQGRKQAALAKEIEDKETAILLMTLHELASNRKTDIATLQGNLVELLQPLASPPIGRPAKLPSPALPSDDRPDASDDPSSKISDDQLREFVGEQPDSNAETLTLAIA
jgi:hypothetical protein